MSLVPLAIRCCTVLALRHRTPAEDRVYDSELAPLENLAADEPRPFLTVAIDEATSAPKSNKGLLGGLEQTSLVIDVALARRITLPGGAGPAVQLPDTTMGLEATLDLVTRRILAVLSADDGFAALWRRFILKIVSSGRLRGGDVKEGSRYAARQIVVEIEPIDDPPIGRAPEDGSVWADFLAALRAIPVAPTAGADPDLAVYHRLADVIEAEMRSPEGLADWQVVAGTLGLTRAAVDALGIVPLVDAVAPLLSSVDLPTVAVTGATDADLIGVDWP